MSTHLKVLLRQILRRATRQACRGLAAAGASSSAPVMRTLSPACSVVNVCRENDEALTPSCVGLMHPPCADVSVERWVLESGVCTHD